MRQRYQVPDPNTSLQTEFDCLNNAYPASSLNRSSTSLELERSSPTIFPARRQLLFPQPFLPRDLSLVDADDPFDSVPIRRSPLSLDTTEDDEVPGTISPNGGTFTPLSPVSLGAYAKFKNWTFPSQNLRESSLTEYRVGDPFAFDHESQENFVFGGVEVDGGGNDHVSAFSDVFVWQSPGGVDPFSNDVALHETTAFSDAGHYSPRSSRMGLEIERGDMHVEEEEDDDDDDSAPGVTDSPTFSRVLRLRSGRAESALPLKMLA